MTDLNRVKHLAGLTVEMDSARGLLKEYAVTDEADRHALRKLAGIEEAMVDGEINEGYKVMPPMDPKYVARTGLEGPFTTLSGKVVYYDPKEGKYYDPVTDIYLSYDEFQNYDKDYSGMKDERDEVKEAIGDSAECFYNLQDEFAGEEATGAHKIIIDELVRYLSGDQLEDFCDDFKRHHMDG